MAEMFQAGELRERVGFNGPTRQKNDYGEDVETWGEVLANIPARVRQIGESLVAADGQVQARALWDVLIAWRPGIDVDMEVTFEGHTLRISGVRDPTQRRRWLVLTCEERADGVRDQG